MRIQSRGIAETAYLDDSDAGEGLSIFFSQASGDTVRWRLDVYAKLDTGVELAVGTFWVSPPQAALPVDRLTRQVAAAVCPGAIGWSVCCAPAPGYGTQVNEDANIDLFSSKCCTAPVGVSRIAERYRYFTGLATVGDVVTVLPGQKVKSISVQSTGAGVLQIGTGGPVISIPNNGVLNLNPGVSFPTNSNLTFSNCYYTIEFLESA